MRLDVVDHIAHLARLDIAAKAAQKLISAARSLVDHKTLGKAHVARVRAKAVSDPASLDNGFLEWRHGLKAIRGTRSAGRRIGIIRHLLGASQILSCARVSPRSCHIEHVLAVRLELRALGHDKRGS